MLALQAFSILATLAAVQASPLTKRWEPTWSSCSSSPISSPETDIALANTPYSTLSNLGPYSPFLSQDSPICRNVPDGWEVEQVQMIMRHGARNPTASALTRILKSLAKVEGRSSSDPALAFVEKFNYNTTQADQLTDFGRREMWTAGKRYAEEYKGLAGSAFSRADADDRVVESGGFFLQGFTGNDFDLDAKLEDIDVVIGGDNNTLSQKACKAFDNYDPDLGDEAEGNWLEIFTPAISDRLNSALGSNVTLDDITNIMSVCSFESILGEEWVESPWCGVFSDAEWEQNEYFYDVSKFYGAGWGMPYSRVNMAGYVNEIIARFTGSSVTPGSGINTTLDDSTSTFPTDKKLYVDFSHDNNMVPLLPALGLEWETLLPTKPAVDDIAPHKFVVSELVPFAARFVFELLKSMDGQQYVRLIVNDRVVEWPYIGCGWFGQAYGMCELSAWLDAQSFARQDPPVWDEICDAPQINGTVALQG